MATITKQQAIDRLTQFVEKAQRDDLVEIYSELFPEETAIENEAGQESSALVQRIRTHIDGGLEVEEVLALWNVIFPKQRRVWFDDEEGLLHYNEKIEPVGQAD